MEINISILPSHVKCDSKRNKTTHPSLSHTYGILRGYFCFHFTIICQYGELFVNLQVKRKKAERMRATRQDILSMMRERILILDGATGTYLQGLNLTEEDFRGERGSTPCH